MADLLNIYNLVLFSMFQSKLENAISFDLTGYMYYNVVEHSREGVNGMASVSARKRRMKNASIFHP